MFSSILQEQKRLSDRKREMMIVLAEVFCLLINCGKAKEKGEVAITFIDFSLGRRVVCVTGENK